VGYNTVKKLRQRKTDMDSDKVLRDHSIKVTRPRVAIYDILVSLEKGVDAEGIYSMCTEMGLFVNLSTVYRTLELFEEKGLISKYDLGEKKYNYSLKKGSHIHTLECSSCHRLLDLECPMKQIEEMVSRETGFHLTEHRLELKGICSECMAKGRKDR
jgi:Fe2+ or Zn2+ uptake regulation protein